VTPDEVVARIDRQELVDLALALGKIDSPTGNEGPAAQFVFDWLTENAFEPKKFALVEERFNVAAWLDGSGGEAQGIQPFVETVRRCHGQVFAEPPQTVSPAVSSMWRDANPFNELGIPALSYGPRSASHAARKSFKIQDLVNASIVYARIAMDLCNQDRPRGLPLGSHVNARSIAAKVMKAAANGRTAVQSRQTVSSSKP
jgi:acetylornithine deacetylase/succinyl-diaminopimelate desuccinylase-like protein